MLCSVFQDPAVLQAISAPQHEPQIADAASSTTTAPADLPASQSQVTGFTYYIPIYDVHEVFPIGWC